MTKILALLSISLMLTASGDQFAVVQGEYVDLISPQGETKHRLHRGEVVKVKDHLSDHSFYSVALGKKVFAAPKKSFREVSSVFTEEKRLLSQIVKTHESVSALQTEINKLTERNTAVNKKISELQIWIEVQKDMSFSRDFFQNKTRGSFKELNKLKVNSKENETELKKLNEEIKEEKSKLRIYEDSVKVLQTKLKGLKGERAFSQNKYVDVVVIASDAAVFLNGKIVQYLSTHTKLKVKKDRNLAGWYIFSKNDKTYYISSKDVIISQS